MNGESVFGWVKVGGVLLIAGALGFLAWLIYRYVKDKGGPAAATFAASRFLKEETPLGIPSRGIDAAITLTTGREETLGGWFAEWLNPQTVEFNRQMNDANKGRRAEVENNPNAQPFEYFAGGGA